jgi:hypothetical protein
MEYVEGNNEYRVLKTLYAPCGPSAADIRKYLGLSVIPY